MQKLVIGLFCLLIFSTSMFGQNDRTVRPRVAATPAPRSSPGLPPALRNDIPAASTTRRPPVLSGTGVAPSSRTPAPTSPTAHGVIDDNEEIRVETNLVTMPVSVLDRDGRFVSGLTAKDFQVFENGSPQKVEYFQSVEQPFSVVLMIDVSPSTAYRIDEIHDAAITFVNQLRPNDKVMVMAFDDSVRVLSRLTNDRQQLRWAIMQAQFGDGTSLYEAVDHAIHRELSRIEGRKAVVLFSDGVDTTSQRATYQSTLADTEESDALFYTIRYNTLNDNYGGGWGGGGRRRSGGLGGAIG
ncbi:MAG: VWA domain-containing protein, partial [Pyrinomonadaceae bacterium]